ncbi:MAG TPA: hypothetical protein VGL77_04775 [Armatimonadota bacterium]|jgi:HEAT repeat protein
MAIEDFSAYHAYADDLLATCDEEQTITPGEMRLAISAVEAFVKAVKAYRYYPPEYPMLEEFQQELLTTLQAYVEQHTILSLTITETAFALKGRQLYATEDLKSSVPFLFYRDGVREISLFEGIEEGEVRDLIQILVQCDHTDKAEDDLVTLLWEKEFVHLDYLAVDDFLGQGPVFIPETAEEFRQHLDPRPVAHHEDDALFDRLGALTHESPSESITDKFATEIDLFTLSPTEMRALQEEIDHDCGPFGAARYIPLLCNLLTTEQDPALFQREIDALHEIFEMLLPLGEYRRAADLLTRVRTTLALFPPTTWQHAPLKALLQHAVQGRWLPEITARLQHREQGQHLADIKEFLLRLPKTAVEPLIRLLGDVSDYKTRAMLCEVLSVVGAQATPVIAPFLSDPRPTLVQDLLKVLRQLNPESALPLFARAWQHRDAQVRKAVLKAVSGVAGEYAERILSKGLSDPDESLRCQTAIFLGGRQTETALATLLRVVHAKGFDARSPAEVQAFLEGLGASRSHLALDILESLLASRPWFARRKADEIRHHAARALGIAGTPEALEMLQKYSTAKDEAIRRACVLALKLASRGERK